MKKAENNPNPIYNVSQYARQVATADIALLSLIDDELHVLLIKRLEYPYKGYWALPGGHMDNTLDDSILDTAKRKLLNETGISNLYIEELRTYSKRDRDPRELNATESTRIFSVAHFALTDHTKIHAIAGTDTEQVRWFKISKLPTMAFDHKDIVNDAVNRIKGKINYTNVGFELLPDKFTIPELQSTLEKVIGEPLDRNNFRTKVLSLGILIKLNEKKKEGKGQPSTYYKLDKKSAEILRYKGLF